jgi:F-type H+-transporting ATPase subunit gamma
MSTIKEIRTQIGSIKNTQKITRAMELVASSKMRKARVRMEASRPYSTKILQVIEHVASSTSECRHPYLEQREVKNRVGYIVVTSDRGLCGGLNVNLFRHVLPKMRDFQSQNIGIDLCLIGKKGGIFFGRFGGNVVASVDHLGDAPELQSLIGTVKVMLDRFDKGEIDALYLVHNKFETTMSQKPTLKQLLPLPLPEKKLDGHWDYIYEPDSANQLMQMLLTRYIESQVYQAVVENQACFLAAQMVAMKSATDSAGELIKELNLIYNKARQASITREIAEIVGGAAAIG